MADESPSDGQELRLGHPLAEATSDVGFAADDDGDFVVAWSELDSGQYRMRIRAQCYDSTGNPDGDTLIVSRPDRGLKIRCKGRREHRMGLWPGFGRRSA
jgi:hypothetical protein